MSQLLKVLFDRLFARLGAAFASRLESMVLIEESEQRRAIEQQAQLLESQGCVEAAADLRKRAAALAPERPAAAAVAAIRDLQDDTELGGVLPAPEAGPKSPPKRRGKKTPPAANQRGVEVEP